MSSPIRSLAAVAAATLILTTLSFAREGDRYWRRDLPPMVRKYFEMQYPFARITSLVRTTENGQDYYEIHSKDYGIRRTVFFKGDGTMQDITETMRRCDLPHPIRHDIRKRYPHSRIRAVSKTYHWSNITFDVLVRDREKNLHPLTVTFDGRITSATS